MAKLSDHLVVMNSKAIQILHNVYHITPEKVSLLHHGVPEAPFVDPNYYKDKFGVEGRPVLLTFGLLSRNKGIELMLTALPTVARAHPEIIYIILGATHPEVRRSEGEAYRLMLQRQVRALHLEDHILSVLVHGCMIWLSAPVLMDWIHRVQASTREQVGDLRAVDAARRCRCDHGVSWYCTGRVHVTPGAWHVPALFRPHPSR